ncbi:putative ADP-ribosylation factor GTPase-activating protein AGD14 [Sesamum angolense]|uniref:ADP-ribosylation factor GTPase-activating protein AGD14 n=1 Tax=Sesamum angolense TaxID=2727404 RepID=A0AAE1WE26_9LAMI|nr:putative ADP-ribosylation factor GTPase-activating protein AGD14 [Sesamum angolense]
MYQLQQLGMLLACLHGLLPLFYNASLGFHFPSLNNLIFEIAVQSYLDHFSEGTSGIGEPGAYSSIKLTSPALLYWPGPQYVCTNFSTFVCTTCSGIHREFTHRVKSVSMAKFTPQEVSALQGGGMQVLEKFISRNGILNVIHSLMAERLRDFIKHVYVDRRYTGERNLEKPLRAKMGEAEDFNGNRRIDTYQGGSRSPPYEDTFERHHSDRRSPGGRSPGYDRQNSEYKRSPAHGEVVNDWRREDRFGNGRRSEDRSSDGGSKVEGKSPDSQRDSDISSPPIVRPVRDILGENVSPLRVIEPPKATGVKLTDGSAQTQRTASSSSLASSDQVPPDASSVQLTASNGNDWANFDSVPEVKAYTAPSNSLESVLSELSIPAPKSGASAPVGNLSSFQSSGSQGSSFGSSFGPSSVLPHGGNPAASLGPVPQQLVNVEGSLLANDLARGQWTTMNSQNHSVLPGGIGQPVSQPVTPAVGGSSSNETWNSLAPNAHGPPGTSVARVGNFETAPTVGTSIGFRTESSDAKSSGRKALPEDLFTVNYSYTPSPVSGWYTGSAYVAGVPMPYNMPMVVPNFQPVSRSANPFDVGSEPSPVQASTEIRKVKFGMIYSKTHHLVSFTCIFGRCITPNYNSIWATAYFKPWRPSTSSSVNACSRTILCICNPPSSVIQQEIAGTMAPRPQGLSGFNIQDPAFAPLNPNSQLGGLHPAQSASSNFTSLGGNPFG